MAHIGLNSVYLNSLNHTIMKKEEIKKRILSLRERFDNYSITAFIIPSTDPHLSEYVSDYWKVREWISGFNGSAGTVVILKDKAGLWTDSRYFIQASDQLEHTGIDLYKEMLPETPTIASFLSENLNPGDTIGVDARMFSAEQIEELTKQQWKCSINIIDCAELIDEVWADRPSLPSNIPFIHDLAYAGRDAKEKIADIRSALTTSNADSLFVSSLDEVAWTLNLRGNDIECNPLFIISLYVTKKSTYLFIHPNKVSKALAQYLDSINVKFLPYDEVAEFIK